MKGLRGCTHDVGRHRQGRHRHGRPADKPQVDVEAGGTRRRQLRACSIRVPVALLIAATLGAATTAAARVEPSSANLVRSAEQPVAATAVAAPGAERASAQDSAEDAARERVVARLLDERAEQQRRATRLAARPTTTQLATAAARARAIATSRLVVADKDPKSSARVMMAQSHGWGRTEFVCLEKMWTRESQWEATAHNPSSGAHGIPQALPGSKMASAGKDWRTNPATQIRWGLSYVKSRYRTPCGAWAFWQSHHWY
ncbi:MAG TPA: hypothetical protein VES01_00135 [Dermatophilaceae bacterium]|nr:hypothetical protein [Dermatophilaceae bacterium]